MLSYILFVSHVNKEGLISTTRNKFLILPSLWLLTLVDFVSLITNLIVGSKTCGISYPYFLKWRKPMTQICHGLFEVPFHCMPFSSSFSFITWHCCSDLLRYRQTLRSNTLKSKNVFCPLSQKPRAQTSSLASLDLFAVRFLRSSPLIGTGFGSISVSFHTSDNI